MSAPERIIELVEDFKENKEEYTDSKCLNEEDTKVKFINPFFEQLGWNVRNKGLSARFREVVFEDSISVGKKTKAPDYSFRIGSERIFFVEAKKPSRDIFTDKEHAFQVRRYGWSAKLPLCVLTNFEELAIYDTTIKPNKNQDASIGRVKYYKYTDYLEKWDEIYNILSKEAVTSGKFDTYANNTKHDKKGTSTIDKEFLNEIKNWRLALATRIALRNADLSEEELNYAVQLTIDRIIFLRIAEDRGIEKYGRLLNLTDKPNIYKKFTNICREADQKYNSGLFHFDPYDEEDFTTDTYTLSLEIDDKVLKEIFTSLYYPNSPYEFSQISVEILGKIYEQFLGDTIELTKKHRAKVKTKPEVKKAGGVYYTPQYIVDYIVENTLGEKIKGLTPEQISKIKVIDPACGSGSFLLSAYQHLLDYHLDYYSKLEKPPKNVIYKDKHGFERLTIHEKKRILKNNIYGVDLDTLAVEVTKLSLLLKVLEDQNKEMVDQQPKIWHERVLPNLSSNIKNGNSLIRSDIFEQQDLTMEEIKEIKPFDWEEEYSEIFEDGGFNIVIGNPPYFNIQTLGADSSYASYLKDNYEIYMDKSDILFYFIYKASKMSKSDVGFIISNALLFSAKGKKLRNYIVEEFPLKKIINFEKYMVFNAGITTCIMLFDKEHKDKTKVLTLKDENYKINNLLKTMKDESNYFEMDFEKNKEFALVTKEIHDLNIKIDEDKTPLGKLFKMGKGMETAADKIFSFKEYPSDFPDEYIKLRVTGENSERYYIDDDSDHLLYYENINDFKELPIEIQNYLKENRKSLKERATVKNEGRDWWKYSRPMHKEYYNLPKVFCSRRNKTNEFSYDDGFNFLSFSNMTVIFDTNDEVDLKYVLCLLNSNTLSFRYKSLGKQTGSGIYEYFPNGVAKLPIPVISTEKQKIYVELTDKMMNLKKQYHSANTPTERKLLQQQIDFTEKQINEKVYQLYDLTSDEIKIIEENI